MLGAGTHQSVLLHEAVEMLVIQPDDVVVDATLGGAGHARAIVDRLGEDGILIGFDLDEDALLRARLALEDATCQTHVVKANFRDLKRELGKLGIAQVTKALFDLGWSAYQLDSLRGFSFQKDEPLLMTYEKNPGGGALTARVIINEWKEESIADILWGWGEERYSRRIAKAIVERRAQKPIETSTELADIIKAAVPPTYRFGRLHPATRTFQALRVAVNDEYGALREGLDAVFEMLAPHGRLAAITFHSIEDRLVKQTFVRWSKEENGERITKKPVIASSEELKENPRARSAKLRVFQKK
ncbi:MAG: Ribosomal RNA small subunit methyltransferase H [Candidatus Kaiserbacteria bacterium GW2011_GWC2_52_8b]|uniref:Ribosomal RNA small subunit methyltransferase H n=2 Tax=Candidatus Kaiseribacteriota TaxID=1752734 RepID=A0A0G1ZRW4_9BACT|nr:MAG: Ribosomal RNA small subunit methyltransferase H [Candidatus Kaiserbacteria bacterium GW2011_GWA2_52_12]KKW30992.1 MAG: Ribosomal RNA small subunit methyltransferase H [Candidatus Kaiserbacteria bacterium GW2011_GWC2_52_8b]